MKYCLPVPHLALPESSPHQALNQHFLTKQTEIEHWFQKQWRLTPPPFYTSVDLRNSGFKLAPVDTNLFPAGFNNLNPAFMSLCVQAAQATLKQFFPGCRRILLIPENHTRSHFYFESLARLQQILLNAGFDVQIGAWRESLQSPETIHLHNDGILRIQPLSKKDGQLGVDDFWPCLVLLNNDLSEGKPDFFNDLKQHVIPLPDLGWFQRTKSQHFSYYQHIVETFAEVMALDPWLLAAEFSTVPQVDFMSGKGEAELVAAVEQLLSTIQQKYDHYGIKQAPYVVVKADSGTYGMGIMTVKSGMELMDLNRKQRTRMAATKGHKITQVIVQEGVYSFEKVGGGVAEPVVYLIGSYVVGGFYRVHDQRGPTENLNAPGMHFTPLMFAESGGNLDETLIPEASPNLFYAYGVIARLAALAAAHEAISTNKSPSLTIDPTIPK